MDAEKLNSAEIVSKAVLNAAQRLSLDAATLAQVLGVDQIDNEDFLLSESTPQWDLAIIFLRIFRDLESFVGSDVSAKRWLNSPNSALGAKPIELIVLPEGLVRVSNYVDQHGAP